MNNTITLLYSVGVISVERTNGGGTYSRVGDLAQGESLFLGNTAESMGVSYLDIKVLAHKHDK